MTTARYMVGDVYDRLAQLDPESVDLAISSPPFLALRSYLPDSHPDKAREIGSEGTPGAFIQALLEWTAAVGRVLAPHGSLVVELGDTYAGSGGHGGDYAEGGWREGQPQFAGSAKVRRTADDYPIRDDNPRPSRHERGAGWPRDKSLAGIPQAYQLSLAYGRNVLTGEPSPAGRWIIRNVKPWIRSNPPVGALGDKERPATSYVIVATRDPGRFFDLDAVRTPVMHPGAARPTDPKSAANPNSRRGTIGPYTADMSAGAPPRDWWHHVDAILDAELAARAGRPNGGADRNGQAPGSKVALIGRTGSGDGTNNQGAGRATEGGHTIGAQGVHLRRALERAGILRTVDAPA